MGYVYLIYDENNNVYKIGVTRKSNETRVKKMQTGNPTQLRVLLMYECEYPFRLETMLHNIYKNKNVLNEWFELTDEEVINFKDTCDKVNSQIYALKNNPFFSKNLR